MSCPGEKELAQFVAGLLPPEPSAAFQAHLDRCQPCHAAHARMAAMVGRLAPDHGEFDVPELAANVMRLIRVGRAERERAPRRSPIRRAWLWAPMAAAAAATVMLVAWPYLRHDSTAGFRARGGRASSPDRWVSVEVFRATAAGYEPVGDHIAPDDALAFAYANPADDGYRYLMILGVDDRGHVFWYYPPLDEERSDPRSMSIGRTTRAELSDETRHALGPGRMRIFAVFSKDPLQVLQVERIVARDFRAAGSVERLDRVGIAGTGQQTVLLDIRPRDGGAGR